MRKGTLWLPVLAAAAALVGASSCPKAASAQESEIEIILDCSGSMLDPLDGRKKIDIAKESLLALIDGIPDGTNVGLRAYSHRYPPGSEAEAKEKSCKDTELLLPIGPIQKKGMKDRVQALRCLGWTPIAHSLEVAARDFREGEVARTIILLSDGKETCGGDPAGVIRRLGEAGFKLDVHVMGFGVDAAPRAELEGIAAAGGGRYWDAKGAVELANGLKEAVKLALPEFAAKDLLFLHNWFQATGVERLSEKGEWLDVKDLRGKLMTVPRYLCIVPEKLDPRGLAVGSEVLAATALVNGKPSLLHVGKIVESKENQFRIARMVRGGEIWVPAEWVYAVPRVREEGTRVKLTVFKAPKPTFDDPATNMVRDDVDGSSYYISSDRVPIGITFKVAGEPREIRRIGILPHWDTSKPPATIELYVGASGDEGFRWQAVGLLELPNIGNWQYFRLPAVKAEFVHLRVTRLHGETFAIGRVRAYEDDLGPTFSVAEIADPEPPAGEAGELEKKSQQVLVDEGEGRYREVKVLKKQGDTVVALSADGKKLVLDPAKVHPLEPIDLAKLDLGDDVLLNEGATKGKWNDVFVRAIVTDMSKKELKVQVGPDEYRAKPDQLFMAPPPW